MVTQFDTLTDDTHDDVHTIQLLNLGRMLIEHSRPWEILKAVDESKSATPGDTYLSTKALPDDIRAMRYVMVGTRKYTGVMFEERILHKDKGSKFYIDWGNSVFALCGNITAAATIVQVYTKRGPVLTTAGEDWIFPEDYHDILPHIAAGIHQGVIDPDDIALRQSQGQNPIVSNILSAMQSWDDELKTTTQNDRLGYADEADGPVDLGSM